MKVYSTEEVYIETNSLSNKLKNKICIKMEVYNMYKNWSIKNWSMKI